jgi:hypothetical protein
MMLGQFSGFGRQNWLCMAQKITESMGDHQEICNELEKQLRRFRPSEK